ncbi:MAG: hypothetical protein NZ805_11235 [Armatimonadetes bacterium]|nr:hypothetical protein [Armatimonadota bacterium]MDW8029621.1 hypothetical protein [Armatimonadota bacterium]
MKETVERAIEAAKQMPEDKDILPPLELQTYQTSNAFDEEVTKIKPKERAELVAEFIAKCKSSWDESGWRNKQRSRLSRYRQFKGIVRLL